MQDDVVLVTTWYADHRKLTDMLGSIQNLGSRQPIHIDTLVSTRPYPFQKAHSFFPNSTTPYENIGANYIQSTTLQQLISSHLPCSALSKLFFLLWSEDRNHISHANPSPVTVMDRQLHD